MDSAEAPPTLANGGSRAAAWAIDASVCLSLVSAVFPMLARLKIESPGIHPVFLSLVVFTAYPLAMRALFGGTGGEKALELRAASLDGRPLNLLHSTFRLAIGILLPLALPVLICWGIAERWEATHPNVDTSVRLEVLFYWILVFVLFVPAWIGLQFGLASVGRCQAVPDLICRTVVVSTKRTFAPPSTLVQLEALAAARAAPLAPIAPGPDMIAAPDGTIRRSAAFGDRLGATAFEAAAFVVGLYVIPHPWLYWPALFVLGMLVEFAFIGFGKQSPSKLIAGIEVIGQMAAPFSISRQLARAAIRWMLPVAAFVIGAACFTVRATIESRNFAGIGGEEMAYGEMLALAWLIAHMVIVGASGLAVQDILTKSRVVKRLPKIGVAPGDGGSNSNRIIVPNPSSPTER